MPPKLPPIIFYYFRSNNFKRYFSWFIIVIKRRRRKSKKPNFCYFIFVFLNNFEFNTYFKEVPTKVMFLFFLLYKIKFFLNRKNCKFSVKVKKSFCLRGEKVKILFRRDDDQWQIQKHVKECAWSVIKSVLLRHWSAKIIFISIGSVIGYN